LTKFLVSLRNRVEIIYKKHSLLFSFIFRAIFALIAVLMLRAQTGYNQFLSGTWFVILFALVCGFIPTRVLVAILLAYIAVHMFTLSVGIGIVCTVIFIIAWMLSFRLSSGYGYVLILIPLLCFIRLPLLIPLVLALTAPAGSFLAVASGFVIYYMIRYVNNNSAVFSGMTDVSEINKMGVMINGFFSYRDFLYTTAIIIGVFFIVFFLKKIPSKRPFVIAAAVGSGAYIILIIIANLIFGTMTNQRLLYLIFGSIIALILALIVSGVILPLDHSRTEFLEFEDAEYYYYVRAVPKAALNRERVSVKRINRRSFENEGSVDEN